MTQSSMQIGNVEAAAARTALNTALEALATLSTGATAPTATFANQLWYDTTAGVLKKRTPANDGWETLITALGLKAMAELAIATKAEAEAGTATDKGMNPLRTAQAIAALSPAPPVKAWVNFDGTPATPTIRAGLNVASVTQSATGQYSVSFTTAMSNANYAVTCTALRPSITPERGMIPAVYNQTTSGFNVSFVNDGGGFQDPDIASLIVVAT